MTPSAFLQHLERGALAPAYLFLGPEPYQRERCRRALIDRALPAEQRDAGLSRHDLDQTPLSAAIDDARSLSLFSQQRVIWIAGAEAAAPRGRTAMQEDESDGGVDGGELAAYLREPAPGVVLVVEAARYDFEGDDKPRLERVRRFYSAIAMQVEFRPFAPEAARAMAQNLARQAGVQLGPAELALLLEATGGDVARLAAEIEKLRLYAGVSRRITAEDIAALAPDARAATIFALVAALGRNDRSGALGILDTLAREGEYMPLALTFLDSQFRLALAAQEAGLKSAGQIQSHFSAMGARIWPERARQIEQTVAAFPPARLERAVVKLFEADRALRDSRPDDRIVMERMILELTTP